MPWRLTPRSRSFGAPLHRLTSLTSAAAGGLRDVVGLAPHERLATLIDLKEVERESVELRRSILATVDDTFVTPVDRRDLVAIVTEIDRCTGRLELAGDLTARLGLLPGPPELARHVDLLVLLSDLVSRRGSDILHLRSNAELVAETHRLVDAADLAYRESATALLRTGSEPLTAVRSMTVLDRLDEAVQGFAALAAVLDSAARSEF
ncbi:MULTISPECIES: DUF47 family protein [unclassified Ornithinimicrobium]|uniref:DUF47 family protein n=1 Tax=unclassified Ornithinimicrobium TaxID=2615080 RepID=UPI003853A731